MATLINLSTTITCCFFLVSEGVYETSATEGSLTTSTLDYAPTMDSVEGVLRCRAVNPAVPGSRPVTAEIPLNVSCKYY